MLDRIYIGSQFLFFDPRADQPLAVTVQPEGKQPVEHKLAAKSLFSRYRQEMTVAVRRDGETEDRTYKHESLTLGQLLTQFTVVTDRQIYKPGQPIRVLAAGPALAGEPVTVQLKCNSRLVYSTEARLGAEGLFLLTLSDYDEAEYEVVARLTGPQAADASCTFSIAQYTLSPLTARLKSFTYGQDGILGFQVEIHQLGGTYEGPLRLDLYCGVCSAIIETKQLETREGSLAETFNLSGHGGPFHVDLITPGGETARVDFPQTETAVREKLTIGELGRIVQAGLLPDEGFQEVRGLHIGTTGTRSSPLLLKESICEEAVLQAATNIDQLQVVMIDPITGDASLFERQNVQPGDAFRFPVPTPYRFFHVGAWLATGKPYEGWGTVIRPEVFSLVMAVPEKAAPAETVTVVLESDRPCRCLLLAYDSRLTSENPVPRLARSIFEQWRGLSAWHDGEVSETLKSRLEPAPSGAGFPEDMMLALAEGAPAPPPKFKRAARPAGILAGMVGGAPAAAEARADMVMAAAPAAAPAGPEPATATAAPARMDFPELIHCELIDLEGRAERAIRLGDQIGHWTFTACAFRDRDYRRASTDLEANKELYVEADLPALLGPGDRVEAKIFYHAGGKAQLTVTSATERLQREVEGDGQVAFPLAAPGELVALLIRDGMRDELSRTVLPPGRMRVTHSCIRIVEPGQKVGNGRIVVFPSPGHLLQDSVEALVKYPFGCAEQTSSKICGLALVYRGIARNSIPGDRDRVHGLLLAGLERMRLFYRGDGLFSLWEQGAPDLHTTHKVVRNLRDLGSLPFPEFNQVLQDSVAVLIKEGIKDNALLPLDSHFAAALETVEDAAAMTLFGPEERRAEALRLLRDKAVLTNGTARWPARTAWGGELESTCEAVRALRHTDSGLFDQGFRTVGANLVEGRLYSTADTRALVELLGDLDLPLTRRARLEGIECKIDGPQVVSQVEALENPLLVRVDEDREVDVLMPRSDFRASLTAQKSAPGLKEKAARLLGARQAVALGERITITVTAEESTRSPICRLFLPPGFAFLTGGANAQTTHQPINSSSLQVDAIAVRPGQGRLRAMVYDMYDAAKVGVLPELELVSG